MEKTLNQLIVLIREHTEKDPHCLIAVDGRCASGKSTFASLLHERLGGSLVHMDDFFLRPEQRTPQRYQTPGENVDHERFLEEVLLPLSRKEKVHYHPFDCNVMQISEEVLEADGNGLVIIEGSYSFHPDLRDFYDLKIFLTADEKKQLERIEKRNPDKIEAFRTKWIPYEELYFRSSGIMELADAVIDTTNLF